MRITARSRSILRLPVLALVACYPQNRNSIDLHPGILTTGGTAYAVVIGVNDNGITGMKRLEQAEDEAIQVHQFLSAQGYKTALLINKAANKAAVEKTLDSLCSIVRNTDRILLYWSGHGVMVKGSETGMRLVLSPAATGDLGDQLLSLDSVALAMEHSDAGQVVLLIDACLSSRHGVPPLPERSAYHHLLTDRSYFCFTASYDSTYEGVVTPILIRGLKGEAARKDPETGFVSVDALSLYDYMQANVGDKMRGLLNGSECKPSMAYLGTGRLVLSVPNK